MPRPAGKDDLRRGWPILPTRSLVSAACPQCSQYMWDRRQKHNPMLSPESTTLPNYVPCIACWIIRYCIKALHFPQTAKSLGCASQERRSINFGALPATHAGATVLAGRHADALRFPARCCAMYRNKLTETSLGFPSESLSIGGSNRRPSGTIPPNERSSKVIPFCGWVMNAHASQDVGSCLPGRATEWAAPGLPSR